MRSAPVFAATLLALPAIAWGFATPTAVKSGPATIPYLCGDGRAATVVYENGSDYRHARARLTYEGRTVELRSAPTLLGLRYRGDGDGGAPAWAWTLRGEQARLTESPDEESYAGEERELDRCVRVRGAVAVATHDGHGDDH